MTVAHMVLLIMAIMMVSEALWAVVAPESMRRCVRRLLDEAGEESGSWRALFWAVALFLWLCAWFGNQWAHRTLFFVGVFFMVAGFWAYRPRLLDSWYGFFLGQRSLFGIRLIYLGELILAIGFGWIALTGL